MTVCYPSYRTDVFDILSPPGMSWLVLEFRSELEPPPTLTEFSSNSLFELQPPTMAELADAERQHVALAMLDVLESEQVDISCVEPPLSPEGSRH